jgi:hypothetical protein
MIYDDERVPKTGDVDGGGARMKVGTKTPEIERFSDRTNRSNELLWS